VVLIRSFVLLFRLSAITTLSFPKRSKTVQFLSFFAKNDRLFAKNVPKITKTSPKKAPFGAGSLSRRRFKPKNADCHFSKTPKTPISPYKNQKIPVVFALNEPEYLLHFRTGRDP